MAPPTRTTTRLNLFLEPTPACSFAVSAAAEVLKWSSFDQGVKVYDLQSVPNPDVSGIGIIIAFLATAYGVFIWMVLAFVWRWLPSDLLGRTDEIVFKRGADRRTPRWKRATDQAVLAYADQQIVTGIAILAAGFSRMQSLSVYHLHVIIYLAWMSSNTHLTAVSLLQSQFRNQKNQKIRFIRLMGMIILALMLVVALVPTIGVEWSNLIGQFTITDGNSRSLAPAIPARCFWQRPNLGGFQSIAALSFMILVLSYAWKGLLLFKSTHRLLKVTYRQYLQNIITRRLDRIITKIRLYRKPPAWLLTQYKLTLCIYLMIWSWFELAESFLVSLWICGGGLLWGSIQILNVRQMIAPEAQKEENIWGFGQLLPVMLLAVPITAFTEGYWSQKNSAREESCRTQEHFGQQIGGLDQGSSLLDTATDKNKTPQTANRAQEQSEGEILLADVLAGEHGQDLNSNQISTGPIWRRDRDIYRARLIKGFFWLSQLVASGTVAVVCGLYLFFESGVNFLFWTIVLCCFGGWLFVTVSWYISGIFFSRLFDIQGLWGIEETTTSPVGSLEASPRRAPVGLD